jgi:uncharacterized protein DUF4129
MDPRPPGGRSRATRLTLVAFVLFVLLAIVGFASKSGFGGASDASPSRTTANYAFSVFMVLFVLAIPVTLYVFFMQGREAAVTRTKGFKRIVIQNLLTFGVFVAIGGFLAYLYHTHPRFLRFGDAAANARKARKNGAAGPDAASPTFERPVLYVTVVLLLVLAVVAVVLYRRRKAERRAKVALEPETFAAELSADISDAIEDLEAEPDPRRAVIAAYARMEGALTRHGIPRRPSETPFEYLAGVLLDLRAPPTAVRLLTEAFERAKFSHHEIDERTRRDAITALAAVRDALELGAEAA